MKYLSYLYDIVDVLVLINKCLLKRILLNISPATDNGTITLKTLNDFLVIPVGRISFCEADGSYSRITLEDGKKVVVSRSLVAVERYLQNNNLIRCHRSYLVNAVKIEKFNRKKKILTVAGQNVPVSRRRCGKIMMKLKSLNDRLLRNPYRFKKTPTAYKEIYTVYKFPLSLFKNTF